MICGNHYFYKLIFLINITIIINLFICGNSSAASNFSITPKGPTTATVPQARFNMVGKLVFPVILRFKPSGCYKKGTVFSTLGKNLGANNGLILKYKRNILDLKVLKRSDRNYSSRLPNNKNIIPGANYFVVVVNIKTKKWLSNSDKYITICNSPRVSSKSATRATAKKDTKIPSVEVSSELETPSSISVPLVTTSAPIAPMQSTIEPETNTRAILPIVSGSLMGRSLPPPPTVKIISPKSSDNSVEPSEYITLTNSMNEARTLETQLTSVGLTIKRRRNLKNLGLVITTFRVPANADLQQITANARKILPTLSADVNHRYQLLGSNRTSDIAMDSIRWHKKLTICGQGLRIGLIDTQVSKTHPAIKHQDVTRHSVLSPGVKSASADHGTAIAALLIGREKSDSYSGMLPSARLFVSSVFRQRTAKVTDTTAELIVNAIDWLLSQNVIVINMSIGGPNNQLLETAISRVIRSGIPVIAAAGNAGALGAPVYPAAQPGVIAVTAIDSDRSLYKSATHGDYIDFAAPGVNLWTATSKNSGKFVSGSSFAVPFVTASIATILKLRGPRESYTILQNRAKDLGRKGKDKLFGWGLVQAPDKCL